MPAAAKKKISNTALAAIFMTALLAAIYFKLFAVSDKKWEMPEELDEVSGICFINDNLLACVQDEKGSIYIYNIESRCIEKKIKFAGKGDYEGIAIVNNAAYVLTGDGVLFEIDNFLSAPSVTSFPISLNKNEESEAICYDEKRGRLLIALKDHKKNKVNPNIFAFDLTSRQLVSSPVLRVNMTDDVFKKFKLDDLRSYWEPADIAMDPIRSKILIVDAINHNLLELSMNAELENVIPLDPKLFPHPEGIAVRNNGSIFICNDGNKDGAGSVALLQN
jgi:uncharacterized protein YjiK